jgi:hypothetical protein
MGHSLTITIPDHLQAQLTQAASATHQTPEEWVVSLLQRQLPLRDPRLRRHFGAVNLGHPTGTDNAEIDEDLAKAYAAEHTEP